MHYHKLSPKTIENGCRHKLEDNKGVSYTGKLSNSSIWKNMMPS